MLRATLNPPRELVDYRCADRLSLQDFDLVYANNLRTCELLGVELVPRERAVGLVQEWLAK
jgi:hypothetical protein